MKELILKSDFLSVRGKLQNKSKEKKIKKEAKEVTDPKGKESLSTEKIEGITFEGEKKDNVFKGHTFSDEK